MILGIEPWLLALLLLTGFLASILHGATGMAGGLVMAAVFSHLLGIKTAVPVITAALIISHFSRGILFHKEADWGTAGFVLLFGLPTIIIGAVVFGYMEPRLLALLFAGVLLLSFPIKYYARARGIRTNRSTLAVASSVWGMLAGNVIGPAFFLAPFLQGTGMNRLAFVGTLAALTLVMNMVKVSVFGVTGSITGEWFLLGLAVGLATVPGNILGKRILVRMSEGGHRRTVDVLTLLLIINFVYLGLSGS